ncbi:periplasmic chaperone for outer membrane proteins Skp [Chitinophaga terrae (ex Kim and Jung 2007)]|jgi:outer membrane protein|uniref:Periplasmic chaperone for outer membrane proteins Skp n=1 Tax=Chitinophaga terrae (ex Kim and Jung 2007) TaxID=408074 RepID=A0A1H3XXP9_9BACT|nr:OmpH family outer membrane protein [Chitinophaga terrae (ex Kim and Jung 2007)]MDQ0105739.1 outer membrane protein [Chitinophaga terrae (ex Kim and Jung 2007)]GEP89412.1 membrane protein [Chitinophaga terrae (ex Kim and Jung 2007)]SEA03302.1 periplasmic chaperone for outer membrane proteins Skp [Chitinophaga terrae (ex Kim and Jung 2007)]
MKKLFITAAILLAMGVAAHAQRYCVIDTKYILESIPEYKESQSKLDAIAEQWQKEIDAKFQEVDKMYKSYQAEQVMLTEELKHKREDEIVAKEKEAKDLQRKRFGYEGDLFKKREELVKPIQDRIYNAVQKLSASRMYDFVLDKAGGATVIFFDPKLDKSEEILKALGVKK